VSAVCPMRSRVSVRSLSPVFWLMECQCSCLGCISCNWVVTVSHVCCMCLLMACRTVG